MEPSIRRSQTPQDAASTAARQALDGLKVLVAHGRESALRELVGFVDRRHHVLCACSTVAHMLETAEHLQVDMVVTGVSFADGDGIEAVLKIGRAAPVPTVIVAERRSLQLVEKAMQDHVMAYLLEPIEQADLEAAIVVAMARFEQFRALEAEVESLQQALEDRKLIERAKGVIMAAKGLTEDEAFADLRTRAQNDRTRLIDAARVILEQPPTAAPPDDTDSPAGSGPA